MNELKTRAADLKTVKIFTGPPLCKADDEASVHDFMKLDGTAVVCGGTTASIVSRVLKRPLEVSLRYFEADVPPMAEMEGFELVTEGIVTLNRVLELLKQYDSGNTGEAFQQELQKQDGAARLARMLLHECDVLNLYVGLTLNPAYQNSSIPEMYHLRAALVDQLKEILERAGKTVSVTFC